MIAIDIVGILRAYCAEKRYHFLYGTQEYQNAIADQKKFKAGDIILMCDPIKYSPKFDGGVITQASYPLTIALGRKSESTTVSSLDETYLQKHDRRLKDLSDLLNVLISTISCDNELDVINANVTLEINQYDLNIDFVAMTLTLVSG